MKVYRIVTDVDKYQYFLTQNEKDALDLLTDCKPRAMSWKPPSVFVYEPLHKAGDFYSFSTCTLITNPEATEKLRTFLEMAGELLPLPFESEVYTLLNVTECINCLDHDHSEWRTAEKVGIPKRYVFHHDRFSESTIFKIPETHRADVLVLDREDGESFVDALRDHDIKGYTLELLWTE